MAPDEGSAKIRTVIVDDCSDYATFNPDHLIPVPCFAKYDNKDRALLDLVLPCLKRLAAEDVCVDQELRARGVFEIMARQFFPNEGAVGKRIRYYGFDRKPQWLTIAGVVADSIPESEYEECLNKAQALVRAVELARSGE